MVSASLIVMATVILNSEMNPIQSINPNFPRRLGPFLFFAK